MSITRTLLLVCLVLAALEGCSPAPTLLPPPTTRTVELVGPKGRATAELVDRTGIVGGAHGIFLDEVPHWEEAISFPRPGQMLLRYWGSCDDLTPITIDGRAGGRVHVTIGLPVHPPGEITCRPMGFVHHIARDRALALTEPR